MTDFVQSSDDYFADEVCNNIIDECFESNNPETVANVQECIEKLSTCNQQQIDEFFETLRNEGEYELINTILYNL